MAENGNETTYKILVLGDSNVGKTCLIHRYCDDAFYEKYISTIGIDCKQKNFSIDGHKIKLRIWDTAGQERFRTLTSAYYRGAHGIVLVYDITNTHTFDHLAYWMKNITDKSPVHICRILIGNKSDLESERKVDLNKAKTFADKCGVKLFETSCKTNTNIDEAFESMARDIRAGQLLREEEHKAQQLVFLTDTRKAETIKTRPCAC